MCRRPARRRAGRSPDRAGRAAAPKRRSAPPAGFRASQRQSHEERISGGELVRAEADCRQFGNVFEAGRRVRRGTGQVLRERVGRETHIALPALQPFECVPAQPALDDAFAVRLLGRPTRGRRDCAGPPTAWRARLRSRSGSAAVRPAGQHFQAGIVVAPDISLARRVQDNEVAAGNRPAPRLCWRCRRSCRVRPGQRSNRKDSQGQGEAQRGDRARPGIAQEVAEPAGFGMRGKQRLFRASSWTVRAQSRAVPVSAAAAVSRHQAGDTANRNLRKAGLKRPKPNMEPTGSRVHRSKARAGPGAPQPPETEEGNNATISIHPPRQLRGTPNRAGGKRLQNQTQALQRADEAILRGPVQQALDGG